MTEIIKTESGIEVIFDKLENISTCSVGVFVKTGSKDENDKEEGISHVLEHMIFKGTPTRNCLEISEEVDYLGSSINAYTSKEQTVFHISALTDFLGKSLEVFFDIVTNSIIDEKELEKEKDVIIEEIRMSKDIPEDLVIELNYADAIEGQYSKPIIGTEESVKSFTSEMIRKYYRERYTKDNIIISVSGNFNKEEVIEKINKYFNNLEEKKVDRRNKIDFAFKGGKSTHNKDINQVNICITHEGVSYMDENKIYSDIFVSIMGGSMSSRLFQEIREKSGLAYSVYSYNQYYKEGGLISTYIGTSKESYEKAIEITLNEFKKIREEGIKETELQKSKNKYMSRIAFSMENPRSRMTILGSHYVKKGEIIDIEKLKDEVKSVKLEEINDYIKSHYSLENITVLGNI